MRYIEYFSLLLLFERLLSELRIARVGGWFMAVGRTFADAQAIDFVVPTKSIRGMPFGIDELENFGASPERFGLTIATTL